MSAEATNAFVVICEGARDHELIQVLADRVACEVHEWLEGNLTYLRRWIGAEAQEPYILWKWCPTLMRKRGVPRVQGLHRGMGYRMAQEALRLSMVIEPRPTAVILVHDSDGDATWRKSFHTAREEFCQKGNVPFAIVIGVAHPEIEAWVLAGFDPRSKDEDAQLEVERRRLGFDPREHGERLRSGKATAKLDAKVALDALIGDAGAGEPWWERMRVCLAETPLERLKARGEEIGLAAFLGELEERLAPCYLGSRPGSHLGGGSPLV